jgi:hypothetical protein
LHFIQRLPAGWQVLGGLLVILYAQAGALAAEPAGRVLFAAGAPTAISADGSRRELHKGDAVEEGEILVTGDGRLQLQFKDNALLALYPGTRFQIERYRYKAAGDAGDGVVLRLLQGGLRTISGLVGKRNRSDYRMETAVATIGIRGTEYGLQLGETLVGNVGEGAIEVCNAAGCLPVGVSQAFLVPSMTEMPVLAQLQARLPSPETRARQAAEKRDDAAQAARTGNAGAHRADRARKANGQGEVADTSGSASAKRWDRRKYFGDDDFVQRLQFTGGGATAGVAGGSSRASATVPVSSAGPGAIAPQSGASVSALPSPGTGVAAGTATLSSPSPVGSSPIPRAPVGLPPGLANQATGGTFVPPGQLKIR